MGALLSIKGDFVGLYWPSRLCVPENVEGKLVKMIKVYCTTCGYELEEPGALLFSPPFEDQTASKYHICMKCWPAFRNLIIYGAQVVGDKRHNDA